MIDIGKFHDDFEHIIPWGGLNIEDPEVINFLYEEFKLELKNNPDFKCESIYMDFDRVVVKANLSKQKINHWCNTIKSILNEE